MHLTHQNGLQFCKHTINRMQRTVVKLPNFCGNNISRQLINLKKSVPIK